MRARLWLIFLIPFFAVMRAGETTGMLGLHVTADDKFTGTDILIRFKEGVSFARRQTLATTFSYKTICRYDRFHIHRWRITESGGKVLLENILAKLRDDPDVEWAEPNYRRYPQKLPNDPMFGSQWYLENTGQLDGTPGSDIQTVASWNITTGNPNVVVAILDSGIDYTHPDLQRNMWRNPGEDWTTEDTPGHNCIDDDHNGYIDDYYGIDAVNYSGDPMDTMGHGTHVAGIAGAVGNNHVGISGVAWQIQLMALKFLDPYGSVADEIKCISYILDQKERGVPIRVVNASFSGPFSSRFEKEAIESLAAAGIMMAAAAGNEGGMVGGHNLNYPASYGVENIISVGATNNRDELASFSNYGFHEIDIAAPGVEIFSTYINHSYESLSGTSMAAPQVTGALALLYAQETPSIEEARERIIRGVDQNEYLYGRLFSHGRLNVFEALTVVLQGPFIFNVSPIHGSPGTEMTITGVRFGDGDIPESRVTFGDTEATITNWGDNRIVCLIPYEAAFPADVAIQVHNASGVSNEIPSFVDSYSYHVNFAPASSPWLSYLILCNYGDETVSARVFAGPSDAWTIEPQMEVLYPWQVIYRNLEKDYGLTGEKNILWVESEKDIAVDIFIGNSQLFGITLFPAHRR